ncbi:MAG TPA: POTRA domain-containing protein, partial [Bryobacteraceae bacterium]|nr:POTRA domain-containing protein [Bryobacteraceae bacterium]
MTLRLYRNLWCVVCLFVSGAAAQIRQFEGKQIIDVQYSPASTLDPADLARFQPLKKGEPLRAENVADAIDELFSTGRFTDIAVEAEPSGAGVIVRFLTTGQSFVGGVNIEGRIGTPPNRGELHSNPQFTLGAPFRDEDVTRAVTSLKRLLDSNGLYDATVTPQIERNDNGQQVFITFNIKEGRRAKYEMPAIEGKTLLSNDTILRATGWRIPIIHWWVQVTNARTRKGVVNIQRKYESQDRLTAKVTLDKLDYNSATRRVRPHLTVDPGPKVELKAVEAKVSKRIFKRYVPVYQERTVDTDLLVEGKRNLEDYFQSEGYYDVDIDFRIRPPENDLETIEYVISKGVRRKVAHVAVAGNKYFSTETIRERMFIAPAAFNLRHGRYSEAFRRKDEANIEDLYKANGFRDVKVAITVQDNFKGKKNDVGVTVSVTEGPQWLVDNIDITGIAQLNKDAVTAELASAAGQPFADVNLATDRNSILTYYFKSGFPAATFKASWQKSATPNHVNVRYEIVEGDRQYVRQVIVSGNRLTRHSLIDRTMTIKAGDPLSPVKETEVQQKFYDLGIFARVDTAIQNPDGATDHKYLLYNFEEANRYTLNVGLGAQIARFGQPSVYSLASPAGATGFSPEVSVDVSRLNFLGLGHTVSLRTLYSSIEKRGSVS